MLLHFTSVWVDIKELSWSLSDGCSAHIVDVHMLTDTDFVDARHSQN